MRAAPLAFFAGIWVPQWKAVRKLKEGEIAADLFAFLTTEPNLEVGAIHPKAMPVILTKAEELDVCSRSRGTRRRFCSGRCQTAYSGLFFGVEKRTSRVA